MAIGAALLFGIRLPLNFASPYKAASIIDFWHRWHMTLSRFLRDYLYIPLGGNRKGPARRYLNLFLTMLLGGLWHGAGWTFILWGALHGVYLMVNHLWCALRPHLGVSRGVTLLAGRAFTFFAVVVAWVLFRADDVSSAVTLLFAMTGLQGLSASTVIDQGAAMSLVAPLLLLVWFAPNMVELTGYDPRRDSAPLPTEFAHAFWHPSPRWALAVGSLFAVSLLSLTKVSEFLYFQF
jgi:D-alanyl-lipoteichoic acid acyltransferase DltB (MBOAT superfamily)